MKKKERVRITTNIGIGQKTKSRLDRYIASQAPRPIAASIVSLAVEQWLDVQERSRSA